MVNIINCSSFVNVTTHFRRANHLILVELLHDSFSSVGWQTKHTVIRETDTHI